MAVFITDEGTNGLELHVVNESASELDASLEISLYRDDGLLMQASTRSQLVAPRSALALNLGEWFDGFIDVSRAYRFGPPEHELVVATLRDAQGEQIGQAFHFPQGLPTRREHDIGLTAVARVRADGLVEVDVSSRGWAQSVHFEVPGFFARDEYFHLAPGGQRRVWLTPAPGSSARSVRGEVLALNSRTPAPLSVAPPPR